jgi:methyl-accepting chemotaxis protein
MFLDKLKISARIMLIVGGTAVGIAAVGGFALYEIRQNLVEDRKLKTQHVVQAAESVIEFYAAEEQAGRLSRADAQEMAKKTVAAMRYGGKEYFWITTFDGIMVMHPTAKLVGKDGKGDVDADGKKFNLEMIDAAKNGGGFVEYSWPRPGETEAAPKITYVAPFKPWGWFVASGIYIDDIDATFRNLLLMLSGGALFVLALVGGISLMIGRGITGPLSFIASNMMRLSEGDKNVETKFSDQPNEIGDLSRSMSVFLEKTIEMDRMREEQEASERRAAEEKRRGMLTLADAFESSVGRVVQQVSSASVEMQNEAESMTSIAEEATRKSTVVAAASEEASSNVQTVATAAEELSASIGEISRQVAQASQIASGAVQQAQDTNVKVQGLADAADKIGEVLALITDIADQTNLLALNATIEAARAGDAGKGFAVVASEVKNLANQTARATEEIGSQIGGIQAATQEAVEAIAAIGKTISQIDEVAAGIASAVEEQGAATQEIARNVEQAAAGTQEVSSNIAGVSQASNDTGEAATLIRAAAGELSSQSETLKLEVNRFLTEVRTTS